MAHNNCVIVQTGTTNNRFGFVLENYGRPLRIDGWVGQFIFVNLFTIINVNLFVVDNL